MHEVGHTLTLTHGGTYYDDKKNPYIPTYELNCKPNFLSVMNYDFQVRGFPDNLGIVDYSGQTLASLDETKLNETSGLNGLNFPVAVHYTRWYAPPNALDTQVAHAALSHCDGSPKAAGENAVRVEGSTLSAPIDWNDDFMIETGTLPWQDVNFNGSTAAAPDDPFRGFNDWQSLDLRQIGARTGAFGSSSGGSTSKGGGSTSKGGGTDNEGSGSTSKGGGSTSKGGGSTSKGGGVEQDEDTANSIADAPTGLTCTVSQGGVPGCSGSSPFLEKAKSVPLTWSAPGFGQIREFDVWRAVGSFPTLPSVRAGIAANPKLFTNISGPIMGTLNPVPPTTLTDKNVSSNTTYTYFVTDKNKQGAGSGASAPLVVLVKF
jgi:hypothetical protein